MGIPTKVTPNTGTNTGKPGDVVSVVVTFPGSTKRWTYKPASLNPTPAPAPEPGPAPVSLKTPNVVILDDTKPLQVVAMAVYPGGPAPAGATALWYDDAPDSGKTPIPGLETSFGVPVTISFPISGSHTLRASTHLPGAIPEHSGWTEPAQQFTVKPQVNPPAPVPVPVPGNPADVLLDASFRDAPLGRIVNGTTVSHWWMEGYGSFAIKKAGDPVDQSAIGAAGKTVPACPGYDRVLEMVAGNRGDDTMRAQAQILATEDGGHVDLPDYVWHSWRQLTPSFSFPAAVRLVWWVFHEWFGGPWRGHGPTVGCYYADTDTIQASNQDIYFGDKIPRRTDVWMDFREELYKHATDGVYRLWYRIPDAKGAGPWIKVGETKGNTLNEGNLNPNPILLSYYGRGDAGVRVMYRAGDIFGKTPESVELRTAA